MVKFIRTTLAGGVLFLLPLVLLVILLSKAYEVAQKVLSPVIHLLPPKFLGVHSGIIVAILALIIVCFLCGLLFSLGVIRKWIGKIEESLLVYLPGYALIKSKTAETLGEKTAEQLIPVFVRDGEAWQLGLLVEEKNSICTVFFPGAPHPEEGEVKFVHTDQVKQLHAASKDVLQRMKQFGKGASDWFVE